MRRYEAQAHLSAAQIRAARAWLNWTQDELARRSGVSQKSIARYESELSVPYEISPCEDTRRLRSRGNLLPIRRNGVQRNSSALGRTIRSMTQLNGS
ncbi:helix-turn-helix transcriptional regulator [Bradyrhizobium sp. JR3.5]